MMNEIANYARVLIFGVGNGGNNFINGLITRGLDGVEYVCADTNPDTLKASKATHKIMLGKTSSGISSINGDPTPGRVAAEESADEIRNAIGSADLVIVLACLGGNTGTGAAPVIARIARESGAKTAGLFTTPLAFEGRSRGKIAEEALKNMEKDVDYLLVIPNERLFLGTSNGTSFQSILDKVDRFIYAVISKFCSLAMNKEAQQIERQGQLVLP